MKKENRNLIAFILGATIMVFIFSCKKENIQDQINNEHPINFTQDIRLLGGWRYDSSLFDSAIFYIEPNIFPLQPPMVLADSMYFKVAAPDWYYTVGQEWTGYDYYNNGANIAINGTSLWDTDSNDSIYTRFQHGEIIGLSYKFLISGNKLIIKLSQRSTLIPEHYQKIEYYYHK